MNDQTVTAVDILLTIASLCIFLGTALHFYRIITSEPEEISEEVIQTEAVQSEVIPTLGVYEAIGKDETTQYQERDTTEDHLEEVQTSLFYAVEPIGRYYITAYSHIETGSRITASGAKVHQGTITTAAADVPKYFHFGDYVEVDGRIYRIEDTGSAVKKRHLDLYEPDMKKLNSYTSYKQVYRVVFPFGTPKDN